MRLETFATVLAWAALVSNCLLLIVRVTGWWLYRHDLMMQARDVANNVRRVYPIGWPLTFMAVALAWIVTGWVR